MIVQEDRTIRAHIVTPWIADALFRNEHFPPKDEHEGDSDYFRRLLAGSERAREAMQTHETWKRRHLNGLRELDCRQRILIVLGELLKSGFLRQDWFDTGIPKEDQELAAKELREQGFEELLQIDGAEWKFALLGQIRRPEEKRIVIDENNAGIYISEMHEKLSNEDVESFFRFTTFTQLAYEEIDRMDIQRTLTNRVSAKPELTPDKQAVKDFVAAINQLADIAYEKWNDKMVVPAIHQAEVKIVIDRDKLKKRMESKMKSDFEELKGWCYPPNSRSKQNFCRYVVQLQKDGFFGALPNKMLAEILAPIVKLSKGTVTNYLSQ